MKIFIETVHGGQANRLLQAVQADLKNSLYIAGCSALGIIDKAVTFGDNYARHQHLCWKWAASTAR